MSQTKPNTRQPRVAIFEEDLLQLACTVGALTELNILHVRLNSLGDLRFSSFGDMQYEFAIIGLHPKSEWTLRQLEEASQYVDSLLLMAHPSEFISTRHLIEPLIRSGNAQLVVSPADLDELHLFLTRSGELQPLHGRLSQLDPRPGSHV